ncbi:hypothetical protein JIP62_07070 [Brevundimonas vitis]|uniref:Tip attachment protein J domain-containing protein n=1 Tax=Brevundimonas vitisensis TaxID=2800818 RepID=A0ABX7BQU9_9CAUL|nr:hypothetical protein [Brevundimonas vitisensis]QQQ19840.1 hypothetical protein JIP62_07070 [Brevundimonas vitisensis]
MPQVAAAVGSAITYVANASAAVASGTASFAQAVTVAAVQAGLAFGTQAAIGMLGGAGREEGKPTDFRLDPDAGIVTAYGRVGCAGNIVHRVAYGLDNKYQTLFCTVSTGPIKGFVSFEADDEVTTFDPTYGKSISGSHEGYMWLQTRLGTQPDTALTAPTGPGSDPTGPPDWDSDNRFSGFAGFAITLLENEKQSEYGGGVVKPLHVIDGVYGWDPRLDSTYPGGDGPCRLLDPTTWVFLQRPPLVGLNWSIGVWAGASGGGTYGVPYACKLINGIGAQVEGIDVASFVAAENVADVRDWKITASPSSKDDKYAVLTQMLQAAGCVPSRTAGRIACVNLAEEVPSLVTVTAADTAGPVEITLGQSRLERKNAITPRHTSAGHRWEMVPLKPISDDAWIADDGGLRPLAVDYPMVPEHNQAAALAYLDVAGAREKITGTVPFKPHMRRIAPGHCFTFDDSNLLLAGVKVRCLKRSYDPMTASVKITFRQETDAKHETALTKVGVAPPVSGTVSPPPPLVSAPTEFEASATDGIVTLGWRNPTSPFFDSVAVVRDGSVIDIVAGAPGSFVEIDDSPPAGASYSYWIYAIDITAEFSAIVGPLTVIVP